VSSGKYLRRNPLARAGFIFYLILIHLWTFVLLFFHAHSFNTIPEGEFGGMVGNSHGPHALMQQHLMQPKIDAGGTSAQAIETATRLRKQNSSDREKDKEN